METNWRKIYSTRDPLQAQLVKGVLKQNQIEAVELNKRDSCHGNFGDIEVYCQSEQVIVALRILENFKHE